MKPDAALNEAVARRYSERGYTVAQETEFLGRRVDVLATRGAEQRVVEVLYSARPLPSEWRDALARWLAESPNHHLDVVFGEATTVVEVVDRETIAQRAASCRALLGNDTLDAALLMAWAVFEAAARRHVFLSMGYLLPRADVLSTVGRFGMLDPDEVEAIRATQHIRNAIAHGLFLTVTREQVERVLRAAETLLAMATPRASDAAE